MRPATPLLLLLLLLAACGTGGREGDAGPPADRAELLDAGGDAPAPRDATVRDAPAEAAGRGMHILAFGAPTVPATDPHYAAVSASGVYTGPVVVVPWNAVDDGGALDWSALDGPASPIARYVAGYPSQRFSVLFEPASDVDRNTATPVDVLTSAGEDICYCSGYAGATPDASVCYPNGKGPRGTDLTGLPVPFRGTFPGRWQGFIRQAIAHLNAAAYRAQILYVTFGVSNGGEDIPRCSGPETMLLTDKTVTGLSNAWIANVVQQDEAIQDAGPEFPVVVGTSCLGVTAPPQGSTNSDECALFADLEAQAHAAHGIGIRITTLQKVDLVAYEAGTPTLSDWVKSAALYPNVPIVWQPSAESTPLDGGLSPDASACLRNGSMATLVPFVLAHSSGTTPLRVLEAYYADLEATYSGAGASGYHDPCWPEGTVIVDPYAPYAAVFDAAVATP